MSYETLSLQRKGHVILISIMNIGNDPAKTIQLSDELSLICSEINADEEARVILLTGTGEKSFSIGIDASREALQMDKELLYKMACPSEQIAKLDRPVITAINGDAIGQGLELTLACDIRITIDKARFGLPHITEGMIPWDGGTQRLSRLVGRGKAMEMILTGDILNAQEAYRIGLVNKVVHPDELMKVTMTMALEMASRGPTALRYAKEAIYKGMDLTLEQGLRLEGDLYFLLHTTNDRTEGIKAFREKKTPRFKGK